MAGETLKTEALCLRIHPWSRTSHVVAWLTPHGRVSTVVKGAVRPKSAFLGQYDLNYTCEIVYYARGRAEARALRECAPLALRPNLRGDWRALALADRFRHLAHLLAPDGDEARDWFRLLARALDDLDADAAARRKAPKNGQNPLSRLLAFEMDALALAGQRPEIEAAGGAFALRGERRLPVSAAVARALADPSGEKNPEVLLDAARAIGVFYSFHVENGVEGRRQILRMISLPKQGEE